MFRLNRHKSDRLGERMEFKFSNFQAFKVPKEWDKLFVSVISVKTGKTIAKSDRATVCSGTCQWTESLSESIRLSQDGGMKDLEDCLFKFIISMGSGRSGILGEVVLNLADYIDSSDSGPLTLPLNNCSYGTILQVKIQCINPRIRFRDHNALRATNSSLESQNTSNGGMVNISDTPDVIYDRSVGYSSNNHVGVASYQDESLKRDATSLPSSSHCSSDSTESSLGRTYFSPTNSINGILHRQDSAGSHVSATSSAGPVDDLSRSNPSSFNSRASGSSTPHQWQVATMQAATDGHTAPPLRASCSANELLEIAEETIDELRDEARMWERHAQKLKIDLEILKMECSCKSKQQAELDMKLSAANNESYSLRREVVHLKSSLEELNKSRVDKENCKTKVILIAQKQLEDELKFLKESNDTLTMQLNKSQEANLELVAILGELEETIEKQRLELAKPTHFTCLSDNGEGMRDQTLVDIEADQESKISAKEEEISRLEEMLPKAQNAPNPREIVSNQGRHVLMQKIENLRAKVEELERDCTELTEENLELIYKLKESRKDVIEAKDSYSSSFNDIHRHGTPDSSMSDLRQLKYQIYHLEEEPTRRDMNRVSRTEPSTLQMDKLKKKCTDLEIELEYFKDHACDPDIKFCEHQSEVEEKILHSNQLEQNLKHPEVIDSEHSDAAIGQRPKIMKTRINLEMERILDEINKQLQLALVHVRNLKNEQDPIEENCNEISTDIMISSGTDAASQVELVENMLNDLIKLNSSLKAKVVECKEIFQSTKEDIKEKKLSTITAVDIIEDGTREEKQNNEFVELRMRNEELEIALLLTGKEINTLEASIRELEMISEIRNDKCQLEETLALAQRGNSSTSECLDNVQKEMIILNRNVETHVYANKMLERKSSEVEIGKRELGLHVSELEVENLRLSERISDLEVQLRYLTYEKESNRLELESYESIIVNLKDEEQIVGVEAQKVEHREKLQEFHKQLSEAQEESEALKRSHSKLQSIIEILTKECSSLQKQTGDFQRQKLEMHEQMSHLEVEIRELQKRNFGYLNKVEFMEAELSLLQSDATLKEGSLASQLECMLKEQKDHEQKIREVNVMLKQIDHENMVELESLKEEIFYLSAQVCSSQDERVAADAVREVSILQLDRNKLESSLHEFQAKVKLYETELDNLRQESECKVEGLVNLLNASKQSEEMLMVDIGLLQRMTESLKSSEEKFRCLANDLELKVKASDYEKQQIMEDVSGLKIQLQKITQFQDEILTLKSSHEEAKFEKEKPEDLMHSISKECEELKVEKLSLSYKISHLQKALHDVEDDRWGSVALEEKFLILEADLAAREVSYDQEEGIKNEINRIKRVNSEYLQMIQCLEEEKGEIMGKVQLLEKKLQCKEESSEEKVSIEVDSEMLSNMRGPQQKEAALESKIHSLQTKLSEALEANNIYQMQLNGLLSKNQSNQTETSNKSASKISSLEAELKEMTERYFHMSLQFAEVEAQREELVMQLKSTKKEKKWFS